MVGIVIVAHSNELANAVLALATHMLREQIPIATAAGLPDPEQPFGTDALHIRQAIESVYSDDGVIVLMDMGSALLSAETALDLLPEEKRSRVRLCEAPLVEGTLAAAVRSEGRGTLEEVMEEARGALSAKSSQLKREPPGTGRELPQTVASHKIDAPSKEIRLAVQNRLGIHARPAARFVSTAARFQSDVLVRNLTRNSVPVTAKSINLITTLGIAEGHEISIKAIGPDAEEAIAGLSELIGSNFGESETPDVSSAQREVSESTRSIDNEFAGIAVSPGIAIGPAVLYMPVITAVPERRIQDPEGEWQRFRRAIAIVQNDIRLMRRRISQQTGDDEAAIFDAHILSLKDPVLIEAAHRKIDELSTNAEKAWQFAVDELIEAYRRIESPYLRARAVDLEDLKVQVLQLLMGEGQLSFRLPESGVVVAADLGPSDVARMDHDKVLGICTAFGGATSHSAILARAIGIPAVVGIGPEILRIEGGTLLALDGTKGKVWVAPENAEKFRKAQRARLDFKLAVRQAGEKAAVTRDGKRVSVAANISSIFEVDSAMNCGADGIGVFRTEFLFLKRDDAPSEQEQVEVYGQIAKKLGSRPFVIRTLDAGGDKPLPYIGMRAEMNPFLGRRGIRLCLDHPKLFESQLRAILRVSPGCHIKILLPMVSTIQEIGLAKRHLSQAQEELRKAGIEFDETMEVGIMVEVPSAVVIADRLATEADFFSIGTNDLCQYVMAADRTNAAVSALSDALHPAILRMIRQTVHAGHTAGICVGVCGEIAGDTVAVPVLLGLGVDELSMNPISIPAVKEIIAQVRMGEAEDIANEVLHMDSPEEVRTFVKQRLLG